MIAMLLKRSELSSLWMSHKPEMHGVLVMNAKQEKLIELRGSLITGGGEKAMEKQHADGKYTARERLEHLWKRQGKKDRRRLVA